MLILQQEFKEKVQQITNLSQKVNNNDNQKILEMMNKHVTEIQELYESNNDHWAIETADLIVLCFELLLAENKDIDDTITRCLPRFDKKLLQLYEEKGCA